MRSLSETSREELIKRLIFLEALLGGVCGRATLGLFNFCNKVETGWSEYQERFNNSTKKDK
jgi:hypothetical protein